MSDGKIKVRVKDTDLYMQHSFLAGGRFVGSPMCAGNVLGIILLGEDANLS